jgi:hypothetical protein
MEVLIATLLIVILLVPALDAMQSGIQGSGVHIELARNNYRMIAKLEETLSRPFAELQAQADAAGDSTVLIPPPYSDPSGTTDRRRVFIARYDGDNADTDDDEFTGVDHGLLWIRVKINKTNYDIRTLVYE